MRRRKLKNIVVLDANIVLRWLLDDNERMASKAEQIIKSETVFITTEVICEIVYVLEKVYSIPRTKIRNTLQQVLVNIDSEYKEALRTALQVFSQRKLDFVDCLLFGYHAKNGWEVRTFDKKLEKLITK